MPSTPWLAATDENDVVCWHYSHSKSAHVKGINILTSMVTYKKTSVPIGYETVLKDIKFTDLKDRKEKRKSNISKNEYFRNLINRAINNQVKFDYAVADNWFSSKENMNYIHAKLNKLFILGIKSNRIVACSLDDKINRNYQPVKSLDLKDGRKRRYLGRYFAHPMMQNRRAKRDDYKPSAVRVTQRYVP
ncbi:transposase [Piscirickettsia salmonis]|uniref:transposase n=1 Tax=Piscirickettsia salmonis TaxID=1238 RepID=UPI00094B71C4|nr:transposase [Piscirickettsia salmonis]QNR80938.1 transposase [Piscirickettsia salmonis]